MDLLRQEAHMLLSMLNKPRAPKVGGRVCVCERVSMCVAKGVAHFKSYFNQLEFDDERKTVMDVLVIKL